MHAPTGFKKLQHLLSTAALQLHVTKSWPASCWLTAGRLPHLTFSPIISQLAYIYISLERLYNDYICAMTSLGR